MKQALLDNLIALAGRLLDALKWLAGAALVRIATQAQERNKELEQDHVTQTEQLEIAARPPTPWAALLERMRIGKL